MGRKTKQNSITSPEKIENINAKNKKLMKEFFTYMRSVKRSEKTIAGYENDLYIFFTYLLEECDNKFFIDITKRDIIGYQNWLIYDHENSPARVRRLKAAVSSLSNYIEAICDDLYPNFRNIVNKIENPVNKPTRAKTVLSEEQVLSLLEALVDKKKYEQACYVALAAYSVRRKSELLRYKVSYFDESNLMCGGSLYKTPEEVNSKGRGGGKYIYFYCLAKPFKPYFDLWMKQREELGIQSEWLFPAPSGEAGARNEASINSWCQSFSKILGVDFYIHAMRHYFTTACHNAGLPDSVIQTILGWSDISMVKVYLDCDDDEEISAYFGEGGIKTREAKSLSDL